MYRRVKSLGLPRSFSRFAQSRHRVGSHSIEEGSERFALCFSYCFVIEILMLNVCALPEPGLAVTVNVESPTGVT
jgi:hypothetical protein